MRQLHETYTAPEFLSQAVREMVVAIPWGHHVNLLAKIEDPAQRPYYLQATAGFGWSRTRKRSRAATTWNFWAFRSRSRNANSKTT